MSGDTKILLLIKNVKRMLLSMLLAVMSGCGHEQGNITEQTTPSIGTPGSSELMNKWCTDCHAPPLSTSHPPSEWPSIVARMQNHRIVKGMTPIPAKEIGRVINYLQTHPQ